MAVVTGLGAVSALGRGCDALWSAMADGRTGIGELERFDTRFSVRVAAVVPGTERTPATRALCIDYALAAASEALAQAGPGPVGGVTALVLGTCLGDRFQGMSCMTEEVGDRLGVRGPRITVSTACSSSTNAIGLGLDLIRLGVADRVIAGGADALDHEMFAGFHALGVLGREPCAPFSQRIGTTLGEGAGFVILERPGRAAGLTTILGYGLSLDAFHDTTPDPSGRGVARAIRNGLDSAGIAAADVDYVNAHGTGTGANDPAECRGLAAVLGDRLARVPVSSSKSFLGHAQGAAGVLELAASLVAMRRGAIPHTASYTGARPHCDIDAVGEGRPRRHAVRRAVSTSSAFAGANAAVVFGDAGETDAVIARARRPVTVAGIGAIGDGAGRVPDFDITAIVPTADPRGIDPESRFLTAAAAVALADAGVVIRGPLRERTGLVVATTRVSPASAAAFHRSIAERGLARLASPAFARMVLNAPAGTCARLLGLKGPGSTLDTGRGGGLVAIAYAAELLATGAGADLMVAGGFDELAAGETGAEGAGCAVLGLDAGAVALAGWSLAGPDDLPRAVEGALAAARVPAADAVFADGGDGDRDARGGRATAAVLRFHEAVRAVRDGACRAALVTSSGSRSATCAMVLTRRQS